MVRAALIPKWLREFEQEAGYMSFNKDWRPTNWEQLKQNIVNETPIVFSPSTGYTTSQKDEIMEKTASVVLAALAEVIVTE